MGCLGKKRRTWHCKPAHGRSYSRSGQRDQVRRFRFCLFVSLMLTSVRIRSRVKRIKPIESIAIFAQLHEATCPSFPDIDYIVRRTLSLSHADALEHFSKNPELFYLWVRLTSHHLSSHTQYSLISQSITRPVKKPNPSCIES